MIKLAFLWNHVKKHKMILRSRYFASSGCVLIFPLNCPTSITGSIIDWQGLVRVEARAVTNVNEVQCTLSLSLSLYLLCWPGRFLIHKMVQKGKKFIKSSGHKGHASGNWWDQTVCTGGAREFLSCFLFSSLSEIMAATNTDKYHHVPLSNRLIWDTNYHTFYNLHLYRPYRFENIRNKNGNV